MLHPSVAFTAKVDALMLNTAEAIFGITLAELRCKQVVLPVRFGGLGFISARALSPVAHLVASWAFHEYGKEALALPETWGTEDFFPRENLTDVCAFFSPTAILPRVWLAEGRLPEEVKREWQTPKRWVNQVHNHLRDELSQSQEGTLFGCSAFFLSLLARGCRLSLPARMAWRSLRRRFVFWCGYS